MKIYQISVLEKVMQKTSEITQKISPKGIKNSKKTSKNQTKKNETYNQKKQKGSPNWRLFRPVRGVREHPGWNPPAKNTKQLQERCHPKIACIQNRSTSSPISTRSRAQLARGRILRKSKKQPFGRHF